MSSQAITEFADTMLTRFPPFRQWEDYQEKAWADDLVAELAGFSAEVIKRAQREMVRTRKPRDPRPPMVSECIDACVDAKRWLEAQKNEGRLPVIGQSVGDEWSPERVKLAFDLIKSGMGKQAARDNPCWIKNLWDFCRKNQRLPAGQEIDQLKREAKEFDQAYHQCLAGEGGFFSAALEKLGASMLAKREKLCAEALGR